MKTIEELSADAQRDLDAFEAACHAYRIACAARDLIEGARATRKTDAVQRMVEQDRPGAIAGKKWSVSDANDFAQLDPAYAAFTQQRAQAEIDVLEKKHAMRTARERVKLSRSLVHAAFAGALA